MPKSAESKRTSTQMLLPGAGALACDRRKNTKGKSPEGLVRKSNSFARAQWGAGSVWERRIVALLITQIKPGDPPGTAYEIPVSELVRSDGGRDYREIERTVEQLMGRIITILDNAGKGSWTKYTLFSKCQYDAESCVIRLSFHEELRPHYLGLQDHFTQYSLLEYFELPSIYSQGLFEVLKSWANCPQVVIPLWGENGLHAILATPKSLQDNFKDFRRRVLDKAYKDINENTSLHYEWYPVKDGRSVTNIVFVFSPNKIAAIVSEAEKIKNDSERASTRMTFLAAVECSEKKEFNCINENNKKAVCRMCKEKDLCKGHYPSELLKLPPEHT